MQLIARAGEAERTKAQAPSGSRARRPDETNRAGRWLKALPARRAYLTAAAPRIAVPEPSFPAGSLHGPPPGAVREVFVLGTHEATATIAVKDLKRARQFYEGKLGLTPRETEEQEVVLYNTGRRLQAPRLPLAIRRHERGHGGHLERRQGRGGMVREAGRGRASASSTTTFPGWPVREGRRPRLWSSLRTAWFKDPDGNIHSLVNH